MALGEAKRAGDPALVKRAAEYGDDIKSLAQIREAVLKASETLKTAPNDPAANLAVGKYECFQKGDWQHGLAALALGDDPELKSLAKKDTEGPASADEQASLGDDWWNLADKQGPGAKKQIQARARYWYEKALPELSGLVKAKVEKRLAEASSAKPPASRPEPSQAAVSRSESVVHRIGFAAPAVLRKFVTPRGEPGKWTIEKGRLVIKGSQGDGALYGEYFDSIAKVTIRAGIAAPASRNLRISVGPINMILNWEGADENHFRNSETGALSKTHPRAIVPGRTHVIEVKQDAGNVVVSIDGKQHFTTPAKLQGTVTIYPMQSTLAVQEIVIDGKVDPDRKVARPSHNNIL
jgi:hypothetical protein